jgi:hypothetical protein
MFPPALASVAQLAIALPLRVLPDKLESDLTSCPSRYEKRLGRGIWPSSLAPLGRKRHPCAPLIHATSGTLNFKRMPPARLTTCRTKTLIKLHSNCNARLFGTTYMCYRIRDFASLVIETRPHPRIHPRPSDDAPFGNRFVVEHPLPAEPRQIDRLITAA